MARYKGTFTVAANYEPLVGGPFDARELVDTKADLIAAKTWQQPNGDLWIYEGMKVIVKDEHAIYVLLNPISYFLESSWLRSANMEDIAAINAKIGVLPEGKTVIDLINSMSGGGYDDTVLVQRIETVENKQTETDKNYEVLKSLVGTVPVSEQISGAIDTLAPIARTGNINDLTQNPNEYLTLACGDSDGLI